MKKKKIVIALGHDALGTTLPEQKEATKRTAKAVADFIREDYQVVITHSNGPQVGMIHTAMNEFCRLYPEYTATPMSVCSAMSQGYIGYDLQNAIRAELLNRGIYKTVSTILTQVVVDPYDEAFYKPSKIIGRVMTEEEAEKLGGIARAAYGLSSTEKLAGAVYDAMQSGAKVVFMVHHGVLICGKDREETFSRAMLLEEICKRSIWGQPKKKPRRDQKRQEKLLCILQKHFHYVGICDTPAVLLCAASGRGIPAQVDDMAQMIGRKIPCCLHVRRDMLGLLRKYGAVLVPRVGVVVSAGTADDVEALKALVAKAAVCCLHVRATGASASLSPVNVAIQHHHYVKKYALQKDGEA